nr:arsenosugar biosynthesis-associated peroxidase-like protein [Neolewinella aurantiaca]
MMNERNLGTLTGPVLIFGGAYSNFDALQSLRAEADRLGIPATNVICCGDTPGYCAEPRESLDLMEEWGCPAIAGNVETNLVNGTDDCGCGFGDGSRCDMFAKLWYTYASKNVSERNLGYMAGLPDVLRFEYAGKKVMVVHGSPEHQSEFVWRSTDADKKAQWCADAGADVIVGGHCGLPFAEFLSPGAGNKSLWLNAGVIGMPANDGTPQTWFLTLDDADGLDFNFHRLNYDHRAAKAKMIDDRRLPVSYAATLTTGIWDNTEIMPPAEEKREGFSLDSATLKAESDPATYNLSMLPAFAPHEGTRPGKQALPLNNLKKMNQYSDPKDLKSFGKIAEWQEEMGEKFFDYYSTVTEGDSALTAREKALIALAVSHAIQCSYCIDAYTTNSLQSGADEEQMMEAVHVAAAVKAGTTLIYARQMQRQVDKVTM